MVCINLCCNSEAQVQTCVVPYMVWRTLLYKVLIESIIKVALITIANAQQFDIGPCNFYFREPCSPEVIKFFLYTSDYPNEAPILLDTYDPTVPSYVNLTHQTKLIVPGYAENIYLNETKCIRDEYLRQSHTNVLVVDWLSLTKLPCYASAVFNVKHGGECTAIFLTALQVNYPEFSLRDVHVIGFSLGAHLPSFVSDALKQSIGVQLMRITGLDPALPLFRVANKRWKLDPTDADFVDVIHTNNGFFGKYEVCGHADFYINGGQRQPSCRKHSFPARCSHLLALTYFTESISSPVGFWTTPCNSYFEYVFSLCRYDTDFDNDSNNKTQILMGEHCPSSARGEYFVQTRMKSPFAVGLRRHSKQKTIELLH